MAERSFRIQVESSKSKRVKLGPYGVPQGSVLGSTIFVIYENDLPAATPEPDTDDQQTIAYVDDSNDQVAAESPIELMNKIQIRADNLTQWLSDNRMVIAPKKTKLIITATSQLRAARAEGYDFSVTVGDTVTHATPSERLLGVTVSKDLTWLPHYWGENWRQSGNIQGVIPDLLRRVGTLRYLARVTSREKMASLVPGMFNSKLSYALHLTASVHGLLEYSEHELKKTSCPKGVLVKLQSSQRQAAALLVPSLTLTPEMRTSDILDQTGMLSVHQQTALQIMRLALRMIRTGKPTYLVKKLERNTTNYGRACSHFRVPRVRLNISHEGFINQAIRLMNQLPLSIIDETSINRQKAQLRAWVTENIRVQP